MWSRLEISFGNFLREKNPSRLIKTLHTCLIPLSYGYRACVRGRNALYDRKIFSSHKSSVPVVSIGNVVVGGTGKTPVTLCLAERLASFCRVAILSRGYRSQAEKGKEPLLLSKGSGPLYDASMCGDEAYLLSSRVPQAIVVVGRDRIRTAQKAVEIGAELILLDDGMQHRRLHRDIEVGVVNGVDPHGGGYFLPRGFLRDEPKRLAQADLIVVNGGNTFLFSEEVPTVKVWNRPLAVYDVNNKEISSVKELQVGVFCGIAEPSRFLHTVQELGAHVLDTYFHADHGTISEKELRKISEKAKKKGVQLLLCTEKDWVKLSLHKELQAKISLPIGWIKCALCIEDNQQAWEELITKIKRMVKP